VAETLTETKVRFEGKMTDRCQSLCISHHEKCVEREGHSQKHRHKKYKDVVIFMGWCYW